MYGGSLLRKSSTIFLLAGSFILAGCGILLLRGYAYRAYESRHFESQLRETNAVSLPKNHHESKLAAGVTSIGPVLGILEVPRLGIETPVLAGDDAATLRLAAGHIPGTTMPNHALGNIGIAAHRDTLFRPLRNIQPKDVVILETRTGTRRYLVQSIRVVQPDDVSVLDSIGQRTLTLVTCYPFYFVDAAPLRFVVQAIEM